jgi:hypothetical protein
MPLHSTDIEDRVIESADSELVKTVKRVASDLEAQGLAERELTRAVRKRVRKICKPVVASGFLSEYTIENDISDALLAAGLECNARTARMSPNREADIAKLIKFARATFPKLSNSKIRGLFQAAGRAIRD